MSNFNEFDDLKCRIDEVFRRDAVATKGEDMSALTLCKTLDDATKVYNKAFIEDMTKFRKQVNKKISNNSSRNVRAPKISKFIPTINEDGSYYIDAILNDSEEDSSFKVNIDENANINSSVSNNNVDSAISVLKSNNEKLEEYLYLLDLFKTEYPGVKCEWNNFYDQMIQKYNDGFLQVNYDLEDLDNTNVLLSNIDDIVIATTRSNKYGELYDFIIFYKNYIMSRIKVNVNDFNPLYQSIIRKEMNLENDMTLKRVK